MGEWECMECGYATSSQKRPERCPECEAPTEAFEFFEREEDDFGGFDDLSDELDENVDEPEELIPAGEH